MANYTNYPAVDENYNFPPEILTALFGSDEFKKSTLFRGSVLPNTNFDDWYTEEYSGLWQYTLAASATLSGLPEGYAGNPGTILILATSSRMATQVHLPYGYFGTEILSRTITNFSTRTWSDWAPIGGEKQTPFMRGTVPLNTNFNDWHTADRTGLWHFNTAASASTTGLPQGATGRNGQMLVLASFIASQIYIPYGYHGTDIQYRLLANASTKTWTDWEILGGSKTDNSGIEPFVQNAIRKTQFIYAMGGPISTNGLGAVSLRCDHGLKNFRDKVLPLTSAMGMKVSQAYNPRNWGYDENQGVTPEELNSWVADGTVEIWNHSANHLGAETESELYEQIVVGLEEIEAQLPAAKGKVWGFAPPGVSSGDYMGFKNGAYPENWDGPAGRLILKHHAVGSAYMIGTAQRILDGVPRDGQSHYGLDTSTVANAKAQIDQAITNRTGLQLFIHPSRLDMTGYITTSQFAEILNYIETKRDSGQIAVLSPYEMAVADSSPTPENLVEATTRLSALEYKTGPQDITSRIPQITRGTLSVMREANKVIFTLYDVRFENETEFPEFFYLDDAIPIGCRPAESYVSFLGMYDVTGAKSRRVRFQKDRRILLYDLAVGDRVNLVATFYTDDPPIDTI